MAALTSQPASKTGVTLISGHPLFSSLVCYVVGFSVASGGLDECYDFVSAAALTPAGTSPTFGTLVGENGFLPAQANANRVTLPDSAARDVLGDVAIYWRGSVTAGIPVSHSLASKATGNGTNATPYDLTINNSTGQVNFSRANTGFRLHGSTSGNLTFGALQDIMIMSPTAIETVPTLYTNGTLRTISLASGTGTGAPTANANTLNFGWRVDNAARQSGLLSLGVVFNAIPTGADLTSFLANPWQMLDDGAPSFSARALIRRRPFSRLRGR